MFRNRIHRTRSILGGAVAALALWSAGCGDSGGNTVTPKVNSDAPKLKVMTPPPVDGAQPVGGSGKQQPTAGAE